MQELLNAGKGIPEEIPFSSGCRRFFFGTMSAMPRDMQSLLDSSDRLTHGPRRPATLGALALGYAALGGPLACASAWLRSADRTTTRRLLCNHLRRVRRLAGVTIRVAGQENLPRREPYIVVCNQSSLADDLGNLELLWRVADRILMSAGYAAIPFFRRVAARAGIVFVETGGHQRNPGLLDRLTTAVRRGECLALAPEGRLPSDGRVERFRRGAFVVAVRAQVPVVPLGVQGGAAILPRGSFGIRAGALRYQFGAPLRTAGLQTGDVARLAREARLRVADLVCQLAQATPPNRTGANRP